MTAFSRRFTPREKILLVILAVILLAGAYLWLVQEPISQSLSRIRSQQEEAEMDRLVLDAKKVKLDQMREELDAILAESDAKEIPQYDNQQNVINMLNSVLASTTDYTLSFEPISQGDGDVMIRRVINMTFYCNSYQEARGIVNQLHDGPYRCQIGNLAISAISQGVTGSTLDLSVYPVQVTMNITFFELLE